MQPLKPFHISFWRFLIVFLLALVLAGGFYYWLYMKVPETKIDGSFLNNRSNSSQNSVDIPTDAPGLESSYVLPADESEDDENESDDTDEDDVNTEVEIKTMNNETLAYHIFQKSGIHIFDLRGQAAFDAGRIRYSEVYDADDFKTSDFSSTGTYLLVCASGVCDEAKEIIEKLAGRKINIQVLEGGFEGWVKDGFKALKKGESDTGTVSTQTSVSASEDGDSSSAPSNGNSSDEDTTSEEPGTNS